MSLGDGNCTHIPVKMNVRSLGLTIRTRTRLRIYMSTMQRVRDRPRQRGLGRSAMDELLVAYAGRLVGKIINL